MALYFSPVANQQIFDANGDPLVGGQIETYLAGSSTPATTYTSLSGGTPQSNPIILNSLGYPTLGAVWLTGGIAYKFIIKDAAGVTLRTIDNIVGIGDTSISQSEWVESGFVPTYISGTSFSVPGDQTAILQIGRRLRTTNTSGLVYSTISNSVFAAGITTVTLTNDSTALDAGLSLVAYALLAASPLSVPNLPGSKITGALIDSGMTMSTARGLGRITASTGPMEELTAAQWTANLVAAASETAAGKVEIATSAESIAGSSDAVTITPLKLRNGLNAAGSAPVYAPRAWVNFNGTGTVGIRDSGNVSSITDNGAGNYTVNFATAMPDANYTAGYTLDSEADNINQFQISAAPRTIYLQQDLQTSSSSRVFAGANSASTPGLIDMRAVRLIYLR
jgi:hypothetical protein